MKIKNNSTYPRTVSGTRIEPGGTEEVEINSEENLHRSLEVVEKSGGSGSDQNTKTSSKSESEQENDGGE